MEKEKSFYSFMKKIGFQSKDIHKITHTAKNCHNLANINQNTQIEVYRNYSPKRIQSFKVNINILKSLFFKRKDEKNWELSCIQKNNK